ncbi:MAG: hypothetical protein PHR44_01255 [Candidatus Omnitrophica bacterium]|nr:hypothetical protein [Candidatus Omnitrophota bacterium]
MLLEVVFAVAIVSVSIVMVLNTFFGVRRAIRQTEDYLRAGILLKEKMSEFEKQALAAGSAGIDTRKEEGGFPEAEGFKWERNFVRKLPGQPALGEFNLIVSWDEDSKIDALTCLKAK